MAGVGRRIDDGSRCTLLVVRETGGPWVIYPHGAGQLSVRLPEDEAQRPARAILADGAR